MSMVLNLELQQGTTITLLKKILVCSSYHDIQEVEDGLKALLPSLNSSVYFTNDLENTQILSEGLEELGWKVGVRGYIDIDPTSARAMQEVKNMIITLADQTSFDFVLSCQYESIYASKTDGLFQLNDF
ncbi:hypothetical protein [Vibrio sp. SCSIO 43137]|uniref:hypothetical protein n=1 Tax=Vibrio sp. SCSIO 43137 TaxID=3021011 RepID=UPI00230742C9|nr:hypothetical protein [Vibrio sp. SCSIO 43137]WCE32089.1 hypothetical protein PK654_16410 [Vibrio sp. SCSIO 43137]